MRYSSQEEYYNILIKFIKNKKYLDINNRLLYMKKYIYFIGINLLYIKYKNFKNVDDNLSVLFTKETIYLIKDSYSLPLEDREYILDIIRKIKIKQIRNFNLGKLYENLITAKERKYLGQVYTPNYIIRNMIEINLKKEEIINNPYYRIIDPACGAGYFLVEVFNALKTIFSENHGVILSKHPDFKNEMNNIDEFILKNMIYGTDIDNFAIFMTKISLLLKSEGISSLNIIKLDILFSNKLENDSDNILLEKFDLVIGNPPYIGHKKLSRDYKKKLKYHYIDVYSDKGDISYCFFKKGFELLKKHGRLSYITSRYFLEAQFALNLRNYILNNLDIELIIDFYGKKVFKGIGISPVIISIRKGFEHNNKIKVYKYLCQKDYKINSNLLDNNYFKIFEIEQKNLTEKGWILLDEVDMDLFAKIEATSNYNIKEVCDFNQGVITGLDKAFIVDEKKINELKFKRRIIKPWVKNSNINKYKSINISQYILYTDLIDDVNSYNNEIEYISKYKEILNGRRECKKGIRKWYQLQWGRNEDIFKSPKIMFPFKSNNSNFTIDYEDTLCSADVYIIRSKKEVLTSLEYLLGFFNSKLFNFYFKCTAKKVGENLFEYYPNRLKNLKIKISNNSFDNKYIEEKVKKIINYYRELDIVLLEEDKRIKTKKINDLLNDIDKYFYKLYNLKESEIQMLEYYSHK